jgi:hypothetical protein
MGAQGLMQVMSKVHHDKFQDMGGLQAALNPVANIRVGSLILKDYVTRGGSVEAGLKSYVGAAAFETDDGYGARAGRIQPPEASFGWQESADHHPAGRWQQRQPASSTSCCSGKVGKRYADRRL